MEAATARVAGAAWVAGDGGTINRLRSDRSLAERFQAGDETAFATIYERYRARVNAICIGVLGSREDALDATQEVFATVAVKLREEPPRDLKPWLGKVARNAAVDIARRRRPTVEADEDYVARPTADHLELQELVSALRELPEQQRTALVMRELGGWTYEEIATTLDVDAHAVNGLIARARLGLRAQREAAALVCSAVRESIAGEEDGRRRAAPIRRHLRGCEGCQEFNRALQSDSRTLRALLPGSSFAVLAAIAALRPRPALIGGLGAFKLAFGGAGAQVVAVCAVGACTIGGMTALDVLPSLPEPLKSDKKDQRSASTPAVTAVAAAAPDGAAVAAAAPAWTQAASREEPVPRQRSIAQPGPEGRRPASAPERLDPMRERGGLERHGHRGAGGPGPAPFDFEGERSGDRYSQRTEEERGGPGPGPRHRDDGGDLAPSRDRSGPGGGDAEPRHDGPRDAPHRDDAPREPVGDFEEDIPEFQPAPRQETADGFSDPEGGDLDGFEGDGDGGRRGPGGGDYPAG